MLICIYFKVKKIKVQCYRVCSSLNTSYGKVHGCRLCILKTCHKPCNIVFSNELKRANFEKSFLKNNFMDEHIPLLHVYQRKFYSDGSFNERFAIFLKYAYDDLL